MIHNAKIGSVYYMAFSGLADKGLYKVKLTEGMHAHNSGYYEMEIQEFLFTNRDSNKKGTVNVINLFSSFNSALNFFKKNTDYDERDMIADTFDNTGILRKFRKSIAKTIK